MAYEYNASPGGDRLSVTGCDEHDGIILTAHAYNRGAAVSVCIPGEDVPEVLREMAAYAGLRYLAQEI